MQERCKHRVAARNDGGAAVGAAEPALPKVLLAKLAAAASALGASAPWGQPESRALLQLYEQLAKADGTVAACLMESQDDGGESVLDALQTVVFWAKLGIEQGDAARAAALSREQERVARMEGRRKAEDPTAKASKKCVECGWSGLAALL